MLSATLLHLFGKIQVKIRLSIKSKGGIKVELFSKLSGNKKSKKQNDNQKIHEDTKELDTKNRPSKDINKFGLGMGISFDISTDENENYVLSVSSLPVGVSTGSTATVFYVYEWFIKNTGEIFYVGKGRGDRYKTFHERAYEA